MAKGKKKAQPPWLPALEGLGVSLGTYLLGQLLVTLLVVRGSLSEGGCFRRWRRCACCRLSAAGCCAPGGPCGGCCPAPCSRRPSSLLSCWEWACSAGRALPGRAGAAHCCCAPWPAACWQACFPQPGSGEGRGGAGPGLCEISQNSRDLRLFPQRPLTFGLDGDLGRYGAAVLKRHQILEAGRRSSFSILLVYII